MGIYILIRPPPCYLFNGKIVNNQPAPYPFMLGAQPEFPKNKRRKRELSKSLDFGFAHPAERGTGHPGTVELFEEFEEGLKDTEDFSRLILIYAENDIQDTLW